MMPFAGKFRGWFFMHPYGQTETAPPASASVMWEIHGQSVPTTAGPGTAPTARYGSWRAGRNTSGKQGRDGEICVRGYNVMQGVLPSAGRNGKDH